MLEEDEYVATPLNEVSEEDRKKYIEQFKARFGYEPEIDWDAQPIQSKP